MQKECLQLVKEACYQLQRRGDARRALLLLQFVLNQYFDAGFAVTRRLELRVVYPALHFYAQCARRLRGDARVNLQVVQHRLGRYMQRLGVQPGQLTEEHARAVFFEIAEEDAPLREFTELLAGLLGQEVVEVAQLGAALARFLEVQRLYQGQPRYAVHLLQQQYALQALKLLQYRAQGRPEAAERVLGHLRELRAVLAARSTPLCYDVARMHAAAELLVRRGPAQNPGPDPALAFVNLYLVGEQRIIGRVGGKQ